MSDSKLQTLLSKLGPSIIEKLHINVPKDVISLDLKINNNNTDNIYRIVFEEVMSFYFINEEDNLKKRKYFNYSQLNSIGYYKDGLGKFVRIDLDEDEINEKNISYPNFAIEFFNSSSMLIEAKCIKINDKKFKVGYPSI